ncbi:MAG: serine--tRNA ligase [Oscillospiraceae bacterium]|nr:serine--tRNA ligase [Oscillospiraceae bacterium]
MLDIKIIRDNPEDVKTRLKNKLVDCDGAVDRILVLDGRRRELIFKTENAKSEQNKVSKDIPQMKKAGEDTTEVMNRMNTLKSEIRAYDEELKQVEDEYTELMLSLPNLPDPDLKPGGKENNAPLRFFGSVRTGDFEPKNHVDLCTELGLIDYPRGAKLAGNGYWIYRGMGARLEWALLNYFIETHELEGYEFLMVPHMLNYECGLTAGQFPKFKDEVYWIEAAEDQQRRFMLPTAETALASIHRDEILTEAELPKKYISYTPCFRREGGSYRAEERGMIRGHQFNKVEMFQVTKPEDSNEAFEELVTKAEMLVKNLGLKFRTVKLAAGDCSASMARTYDIEVYIPSMGGYKEVSSVSNARDYQARRGQIRFRREETGKIEFCHTLNGSGLATSRILPAIVEQYQNADGSVEVPKALRRFMRGKEIITKKDIERVQMKNPLSCG